jgi:iron(III) transport system ATP-binding protein
LDNVAFGLRVKGVAKTARHAKAHEMLDWVALSLDERHRRPAQLSGGQQQRVALARALVIRPRCLLLDEPLSNLDARLRLEMRTEIRRICKEFKLTTVYVTHDQKEALSVSDRMAVMEGGHILQVGSPQEIYRRPTLRTVADFIGETNFLSGKVTEIAQGRVRVATDVGEFLGVFGDAAFEPAVGAAVTLSVRPECWALSPDNPGQNAIRGRIGKSVYLGENAQYDFVAGSTTLKVLELNPRFIDVPEAREVFASARPEDVVVLKD